MVTLTLKLCLTVSRWGMLHEKVFKDIVWSHIFRKYRNFVTLIENCLDGWKKKISNLVFNGDIDPNLLSYS